MDGIREIILYLVIDTSNGETLSYDLNGFIGDEDYLSK